jgi:hypothetical protein
MTLNELVQRRRDEQGVIALLTLLFIMTVGLLSLMIVWALGYTSGAYTTLYGAAQSAAYAAASEVNPGAGSSFSQPPFDCGSGFSSTPAGSSVVCTNGRAATAARALLTSELSPSNSAGNGAPPYGLSYSQGGGGTVQLLDGNGNAIDGVLAYEIALPPGAAHNSDPNCVGTAADPSGGNPIRSCWTNPASDFGVADFNYSSGIVVIARATVKMPMCPQFLLQGLCNYTITVSVPARIGQQQVFPSFNK